MEVNGVEFEDETEFPLTKRLARRPRETLTEWLMRIKVAKTPIQANYLLLIIVVIAIVLSVGAAYVSNRKPVGPTRAQQAQFNAMNIRH